MFEPEVIEIGSGDGLRSSNFGSGIELLMNDKTKRSIGGGGNDDIKIDDLDNLENELNDLVDIDIKPVPISLGSNDDMEEFKVSFDEIDSSTFRCFV